MPLTKQSFHLGLNLIHFSRVCYLDVDTTDIGNTHETFLCCSQRDDYHVVLVLSHGGLSLAFQHTYDSIGRVIHTNHFSHRVRCTKKIGGNCCSYYSHTVTAVHIIFGNKCTSSYRQ